MLLGKLVVLLGTALSLVVWPLVWLLSLPLRLVGVTLEAVFALLRAVLLLPARLFGYRDADERRGL